jgi:solute carrier family 25 oxoglutarate transporter 11
MHQMNGGKEIPFWQKTLSGMASGAIAVSIGTPFDVSLVRMQSDSMKPVEQRRNYRNVIDAVTRVMREEGFGALYAGLAPNILRGMAMNVGMMAAYDEAKSTMSKVFGDKDKKNPSLPTKLSSSAIAGFTAAAFSLPFDMLKSRMQDQRPDKTGKLPYAGLVDCAGKVMRKEGVLAFWTGFPA